MSSRRKIHRCGHLSPCASIYFLNMTFVGMQLNNKHRKEWIDIHTVMATDGDPFRN